MARRFDVIEKAAALRFQFGSGDKSACDCLEQLIKARFHVLSIVRYQKLSELAELRRILKHKNIVDLSC